MPTQLYEGRNDIDLLKSRDQNERRKRKEGRNKQTEINNGPIEQKVTYL